MRSQAQGSAGLQLPVTLQLSANLAQNEVAFSDDSLGAGVFVDWLTIRQSHAGGGLPVLKGGSFVELDASGKCVSVTEKRCKVIGSHETSVFLRCDGHTVEFSGNISRFGRRDNLWGLSFPDAIRKVNALLCIHGLPSFTPGRCMYVNVNGHPKRHWTGAVITRLDFTKNFFTGSKADASAFMRWLQSQQASRLKTGVYADGETVDWGRGSRYIYQKVYTKANELRVHNKLGSLYVEKLAVYCDAVGLVRYEVEYKSMILARLGCRFLGSFNENILFQDFEERSKALFLYDTLKIDDMTELPQKLLGIYRMWQSGDDLSRIPRRSFYRYRNQLRKYGVDIAVKSNVRPFPEKVRVIRLGVALPPDWYDLAKPFIEVKNGTFG